MPAPQNVIALVFDFDDTLTDDSLTLLLEERGVDVKEFWETDVASLVKDGWDPPLAFMHQMLRLAEPGQPLEGLTVSDLKAFGRKLKPYPGLKKFLDDDQEFVQSKPEYRGAGIKVEYYVITSGLQEIVDEFPLRSLFKDVWGSSFHSDPESGAIRFPKNAVTFTDKTRFLFHINKGLVGSEVRANPDAVNEEMAEADRPIPLHNMIYIGDGLTDVPCFSLVENGSGHAFGISHPDKPDKERRKRIAWNLLSSDRTKGVYRPQYAKGHSLRYVLDMAVEHTCTQVVLRRKVAL